MWIPKHAGVASQSLVISNIPVVDDNGLVIAVETTAANCHDS
ncbi:MAG: hypothetical protein ABL887_02035 [Nitrosomonas sp.]